MATVQDAYTPGPRPHHVQYVLIEDVHSHPEAQGKIAALILYAHDHWGTRQVLVEGAFGEVGPPPFPIFSVERGQLSANELLRRGQLSGGELSAALVSHSSDKTPFKVIGIDDPQLYRCQLDAYHALVEIQNPALQHLKHYYSRASIQRWRLVWRLLELRLSPQDYQAYLRGNQVKFQDPLLRHAIHLAEMYYRSADQRSHQFLQRAPALTSEVPCLIVVGGFHMPVLMQTLRSRKKTFLVLKLHTTEAGSGALYRERLTESFNAIHEIPPGRLYSTTLQSLRLSLSRRHPDHPVSL